MKECQLQIFHSVFQCAAWCLHKSLWLNYSGGKHLHFIWQPLTHRSATNSPTSSKSSKRLWLWTGWSRWLRETDRQVLPALLFMLLFSVSFYWCNANLHAIHFRTYDRNISRRITSFFDLPSHPALCFFLAVKMFRMSVQRYMYASEAGVLALNVLGALQTKSYLNRVIQNPLSEVVLVLQVLIPTTNSPSFNSNTVKGLK